MSYSVLIVEDSAVMRQMIRRALVGCIADVGSVQEATDGKQALHLMRNVGVDLVLTDINMPHIDGTSMLEEMQSQSELSDIPTVVITSDASQAMLKRVKDLGVKGCLLKPFRPDHLRAMVMRALSGTR